MAQLSIVAGPNGVGKTTVASKHLVGRLPVVSPDTIAVERQLTPGQAGRAALALQAALLARGASSSP